jgi:ribosomal protein S18 acetylase RimI-like enzyme
MPRHTPRPIGTPAGGHRRHQRHTSASGTESRAGDCEPDQDHPVTIRPATVADQAAIAELNAVVQQMHHDVAPEWFKPPEMEAILDYFRQALRSDALRAFVVEADGAVRGYAVARLQKQPETALTYGGLVVELDQISVNPAYRGRGLGRQLIDQVKWLASDVGAARLQLTVWEFNKHAREVFERAGFTAMTTRMVAND